MTMRVLALTLLAALGAVPGSALAAPPKLAVRVQQADTQSGSFFTLRAKPGQRASAGTIVVLNRDNKAITVDVDPVDAMTANNFASAYEVRAERKAGPTLWTRLSARRVTIAPKGRARVEVRAAIPKGVEGGEYLSGVAIEARGQRDSTPDDKQVAVSVAQRFAVGFQVNVSGQREPKVALSGARIERKPAGVTFLVGAHNTGNVILKGVQGRLQVDSADGKRVLVQKLGPGTFVSGTKIDVSALAERARPQAGDKFRVRAELRYPGGVARLDENVTFGRKAAQAQEEFGGPRAGGGIPSWLWALIAAAVLVGAAAAARRIAVRRRRPLTREAALRLLTDEHDHARASGEPLSVQRWPRLPSRAPTVLASPRGFSSGCPATSSWLTLVTASS